MILLVLSLIGISVGAYTLAMMSVTGASAEIKNSCIYYKHPMERSVYVMVGYLLATVIPFFLSSFRSIVWLGVANAIACGIAYYFYTVNFVSVWCFFGAVVSGLIYSYFNHIHFRAPKWRATKLYRLLAGN
jgi:hypothetical protein